MSSGHESLLKLLASGNKKFAGLYKRKRRREEQGKSDSEDDVDSSSKSTSLNEENYDSEGSVHQSYLGTRSSGGSSFEEDDGGDERIHSSMVEQSNDVEVSDEDEYDDDEEEPGNEDEARDRKVLETTSPFYRHLGHILQSEDVDMLMKQPVKFRWELPVPNFPNFRLTGTGEPYKEDDSDAFHGLKEKLYKHFLSIFDTKRSGDFHSSRQKFYLSLCSSYRDIMHCNKKPFYMKGQDEDSAILDAYIVHVLNHIYKTRDLITKNDSKLNKHQQSRKEDILSGGTFLDHGFTRPKVLLVLPLASIALRVVKRLIQLCPPSNKTNIEHIDRFNEEFGSEDIDENVMNNENVHSGKTVKPADFQVLFGGNNNDHFMIGIKFTKGSIKLYADFYSSDIILASPLGLVTKIEETKVEKDKDVDYLSSIEVLIIDYADVIAMQNWSHVNTVVEHLNQIPSKQHGTDIMRIRQLYVDGRARFYRQTILLGAFHTPEMHALFCQCVNYKGKVKLVSKQKGVLSKVLLQTRQVYERFVAASIVDADEARFTHFTQKVFPKIKESIEGGLMIFISSYFEFVRIRNFLNSQKASFCVLDEYSKQSDISRSRVWFFEGKKKIMLYTERAHFYHRYKIRGIQNLIIYSLPDIKEFYPEILNLLGHSRSMTCNVLFSHFDLLKLQRIVGDANAKRLVSSSKCFFVFC